MWCGDVRRRYREQCGAVQCNAIQSSVEKKMETRHNSGERERELYKNARIAVREE